MSLRRPTIVLFDMDGTTVRHLYPWFLTILEKTDDAAYKSAKFFSRVFRRNIKSPPLVAFHGGKRQKLLVRRALHRLLQKPVDQIVEPCPGVYDALDFLAAQNIPMAIISNGLGKGYGHDILKTFDLEKYFEVQLFREDIQRAKPHPDPLLQALRAMKRQPAANDVVWYIGDRHKDVRAAIAARAHLPCPVEPIAYNLNAAVAVLEHGVGTDHIFMAWPDILNRLKDIFKK
jgi:phosphoglycolate phosphatase